MQEGGTAARSYPKNDVLSVQWRRKVVSREGGYVRRQKTDVMDFSSALKPQMNCGENQHPSVQLLMTEPLSKGSFYSDWGERAILYLEGKMNTTGCLGWERGREVGY